ncbi:hypothetical protein HALDL1_04215 [Halobacterium sp. DL1]|nr:hypothetical protein HALDL1_04215 [Halobacterium sp. DL1]
MYLYSPGEIDRERAYHQAVIQCADDVVLSTEVNND